MQMLSIVDELSGQEPSWRRGGGVQTTFGATLEVHGQARPVCVAEVVFRYHP